MEFNFVPDLKTTRYFVDKYNLMLRQNSSSSPSGDYGIGDCIGRTLDAYITYEYEPFIQAVKNCYRYEVDKHGGVFLQAYRHPTLMDEDYNSMSRDHIYNTIILMKLVNDPFLDELASYLKWKISDKFNFSIGLWLWMEGIAGNKLSMFLYYLIDIPLLFGAVLWNKFVYFIGGFGKELPQDEFVVIPYNKISDWKKKWRERVYPMYTINQKAFAMYVSPKSLGKRIFKRICLWGVLKQNFLLRIMFGGKVTEEEVLSYKPMTGGRWSTYLNDLNDRDVHIVTKPEYLEANVLDVDLLKKMYAEFA